MHDWSSDFRFFEDVGDAAFEIGVFLARWGRISVLQTKEKFGTARVYCSFGFSCFHALVWPRHYWIHQYWPYAADLFISDIIRPVVDAILIPYQKFIYKLAYLIAVIKRPHIYEEIVCGADWGELFDGVIPGYKHSDYWVEVKSEIPRKTS